MSEQFAEQADFVVDNDTSALDEEPSVILDEDRIDSDPLEDGMDTAEGYSRDMRLGGTLDAEDQDTLAYRIPQEEPDVTAEEPPGRPVAATPAMDLDESVDDPANAVDGVGDFGTTGAPVFDPLDPDGAVDAETLTEGDGEVELGVSSEGGAAEPTGLPADDSYGEAARVEREWPTEGAEAQALHVEQES
ncbi:MAG TPA: hypothetical protein VGH76_07590 [Actinomycetospora sp.]|uniref:hypothetical protein n=1 Tax=Actinomycetospora sp. TaxID=1872135 RepID=UPI002F400C64